MIRIKFSHRYVKMPEVLGRPTYLVGLSVCAISHLPEEFLSWDTLYLDGTGMGHYPLPEKGRCMVLTLCTPDCVTDGKAEPFKLWTTIRPWTWPKELYYTSQIGKRVEIVVEIKEGGGRNERQA